MKKSYIAVLGGLIGILLGCCLAWLYFRHAAVKQLSVQVARVQWACRTSVLAPYTYTQHILVGKIIVPTLMTSWREVASHQTSGEGNAYVCPRFTIYGAQHEVFVPAIFVSFVDAQGTAYQHRIDEPEVFTAFTVGTAWKIELNQSEEVIGSHPITRPILKP